jgi:starch synthase
MERGLPVVATDVGGMRDMVVDGETGILVPQEDPDALAAALNRVLDDAAGATAMGQAGRARVIAQFSSHDVITRVAAAYEKLGANGAH